MLRKECTYCGLHNKRTRVVFGDGNARGGVMFVGEAPGEKEDIEGRPFVGLAGKKLWKVFGEATGKGREAVYVTNTVKCRPPENRAPFPEEVDACSPFLKAEIVKNKPKVIFAFGKTAIRALCGIKGNFSIKGLRRSGPLYYGEERGVLVIPSYHPSSWNRWFGGKAAFREDLNEPCSKVFCKDI